MYIVRRVNYNNPKPSKISGSSAPCNTQKSLMAVWDKKLSMLMLIPMLTDNLHYTTKCVARKKTL